MKSPFKFLDAYTADDREQFWGREEEVAALYSMVMKNRLILVYGQSGTGKTSLVQCGLASKFDATDWLPLFIRRQQDINRSLENRLATALNQPRIESANTALGSLYETYLRTPYLIFDQLEELFVLGSLQEQDQFAQTIKSLLETNIPCRIMLIVREEYLAHLYHTERILPTLFDGRLRVEPMSVAKVQKVLMGSFDRFHIAAQAPVEQTAQLIIDNISGGKAGIQLPYLQVYLDTLYREAFSRRYPGEVSGLEGEWKPVTFMREEVGALGKIDNVLDRFLLEQIERLEGELKTKFGNQTEEGAVRKVLDAFVSDEGTKRPIGYIQKGDKLVLESGSMPLFESLDVEVLGFICRSLEQSRLLRFEDEHIELAHDALAQLIESQRTTQQRRLRTALSRLQSSLREYLESGEYLSRRQLNSLEELMPALTPRLNKEIQTFIEKSRLHVLELEQAELAMERQKRRQARRFAIVGLSLAVLATIACVLALQYYRNAARNAADAYRNLAIGSKIEGKYDQAIAQLGEINQFSGVLSEADISSINQLRKDWQQVRMLVVKGDSLATLGEFKTAGEQYQAARGISPDAHLESLCLQAEKDLEEAFEKNMRNGEVEMMAHHHDQAVESFGKALRLKPGDETATRKMEAAQKR